MNDILNWLGSGDWDSNTSIGVVLSYVALNIYTKVTSAPTIKEGWANVLKGWAQKLSATDFKGGKAFTLPGAKGKPDDSA